METEEVVNDIERVPQGKPGIADRVGIPFAQVSFDREKSPTILRLLAMCPSAPIYRRKPPPHDREFVSHDTETLLSTGVSAGLLFIVKVLHGQKSPRFGAKCCASMICPNEPENFQSELRRHTPVREQRIRPWSTMVRQGSPASAFWPPLRRSM
jgi:hypothetical protein